MSYQYNSSGITPHNYNSVKDIVECPLLTIVVFRSAHTNKYAPRGEILVGVHMGCLPLSTFGREKVVDARLLRAWPAHKPCLAPRNRGMAGCKHWEDHGSEKELFFQYLLCVVYEHRPAQVWVLNIRQAEGSIASLRLPICI